MNINYNDDDIAPFICGTVVRNGGFKRKLKMLRADLYSVLAMSNSSTFITEKKQSRAIRRGIEQFCLDSQKIKMQECLDQFSGWESVLADYVLRNELNDVETVNFPKRIDEFQPEWDN